MIPFPRRPWLRFFSSTGPFTRPARSDVRITRLSSDPVKGVTVYQFQRIYAVRAPLATLLRFGIPRDRLVVATDRVVHGRFPTGILRRLKPAYLVEKKKGTNNYDGFLYATMKPAEAWRRIAEYNARIPERPPELARKFPREKDLRAG